MLMRTLSMLVCTHLMLTGSVMAQRGAGGPPPFVRTGATEQVSDHVYVIPDDNVGFVPNVGIIAGDRATLVVDTGLGPRNGEIIMGEVGNISSNDELYVVSTHFHPEHALGETGFPARARVLRARAQQEDIDEFGLDLADRFAGFSQVNAELLQGAEFRQADVVFDRETVVDLGGVRARVFWLGPTHTRGDTVVFVEGDGVLFAGDVVMNRRFLSFNSEYSSLDAWLDSLRELERLDPTRIVPSHGAMGDASLIAMNRGYLEAIRTRVVALKEDGMTLEETVESVASEIRSAYPDWAGGGNAISSAARIAYTEAN